MPDLDVVVTTILDAADAVDDEAAVNCRTGSKQFGVNFADGSADDCTVEFYGSVDASVYDTEPFHTVTITGENAVITSFASDDRYAKVKAVVPVLTGGSVSVFMSQ